MCQKRKLLLIVLILFVLFFVPGNAIFSKDKSVSLEKEAVKSVLMDYENAWNRNNTDAVVTFYHQNAQIMTGARRKIVSREQYADTIPDRFEQFGSMTFSAPKIKITGDKAKVKVTTKLSRGIKEVKFIFYMIRQNDRWLIIKTEY